MIVSIDIGTSYSSLSMLGKDGKPIPVPIGEDGTAWGSKFSMPSAVFLEDDGSILVGQAAMRSRLRAPKRFRKEFKRNLGEDYPLRVGEKEFRVEELYTELLQHMKACVKKITGEEIERAYLTYPATYKEDKMKRLRYSARAAGLFQVKLMPEPTAAAMSYVAGGYVKDGQTVLVYDFGGGTFDTALIRYRNGEFKLLGTPLGLPRCGGMDMDRIVYRDMQKAIGREKLEALEDKPEQKNRFLEMLSEKAVQIKHQLSSAREATEYIPMGWDQIEYTLTREKFEGLVAPMIDQTIHVCEDTLAEANLKKEDLSAIVLVGGTSRVPLVQQMVQGFAGKVPVYIAPDVDLAVVQGALSYSSYQQKQASPKEPRVTQNEKKAPSEEQAQRVSQLAYVLGTQTTKEKQPPKAAPTLLAPVCKDGKWGYINQEGKIVLPLQWDAADGFSEGLAWVRKELEWGAIDKYGQEVISKLPYGENPQYFSEGYAAFGGGNYRFGGYWHKYIDRHGKTIDSAHSWKNSANGNAFHGGLARVAVYARGFRRFLDELEYGFMDKSGKLVIPCQFDYVGLFYEGLALVQKKEKYSHIDKSGRLVIPYQWDDATEFSEGMAAVKRNGKWGFIDKAGQLVIPCQWDGGHGFHGGIALVKKDGKYGYICKDGNMIIPFQWDHAHFFSEEMAGVERNGKWGFIDKAGQLVIPCQWDDCFGFNGGIALVRKDWKYGCIDKTGQLITPCQWDGCVFFKEGIACVKKDGKYGYIDKTGQLIIPCQWDGAGDFHNAAREISYA